MKRTLPAFSIATMALTTAADHLVVVKAGGKSFAAKVAKEIAAAHGSEPPASRTSRRVRFKKGILNGNDNQKRRA